MTLGGGKITRTWQYAKVGVSLFSRSCRWWLQGSFKEDNWLPDKELVAFPLYSGREKKQQLSSFKPKRSIFQKKHCKIYNNGSRRKHKYISPLDKWDLIKRLFMLENKVLPVPRREKRQAEGEGVADKQPCLGPLIIHKRPCDGIPLLHLFLVNSLFFYSKCYLC